MWTRGSVITCVRVGEKMCDEVCKMVCEVRDRICGRLCYLFYCGHADS